MSQKRNREGENEVSSREKKKLKMSAARSIAVQSTVQPEASSSTARQANSLSGLPSAIDVEKFVEARAFEINAMQNAMKTASEGSTFRVWQTLPRHLRRRAASHDVRRVPLRLRDRARAEMDVVKKKALGRSFPKQGKDKRITRTASFLKRQRNKVWLETHLWHAKRMHMENLWGYRLAIQPTEKAYRASYRATIHDAIIHDASYYTIIEINGPELLLKSMFDRICDPQRAGPGSPRYLSGSRTIDTHIYKLDCYPYDLIGPATVMWRPLPVPTVEQASERDKGGSVNDKGKGTATTQTPQADSLRVRSLWIRFHPSVNNDMLDALKQVASQTLSEYKEQNRESEELKVEMVDRKGQMNVFEILGPKSSQVLKGSLRLVATDKRKDFLQFWNALGDLQSSGSLPRGMIIGCKVNDPRLNFPPKNAKVKAHDSQTSTRMVFPSAQLAEHELWDERIRSRLATPRFKKKDLDERRSKNDIPGTTLSALREDDRIPIILIQRSLEPQNSDDCQAIHGWTLVLPAGWSMAFFNSLTHSGTRVAGQRERQAQAYEAGTVYFPRDYPFTSAYDEWSAIQAKKGKEKWDRKPPAKRVNFEKLGTEHPWRIDWNEVLGIENPKQQCVQENAESAFVSTQRELVVPAAPAEQESIRPWLLRGSDVPKILSNLSSVLNHGAALLSDINRFRLKRGLSPLASGIRAENLLKGALINVRVTMCSRGTPEDLAMIHSLQDDILLQWRKVLHIRQSSKIFVDEDTPQETVLANTLPDQNTIIGYITTGQYSLARGQGYGLGSISLRCWLELEQQNLRLNPNRNSYAVKRTILVGVRNTDGIQCRAAYLEVVTGD